MPKISQIRARQILDSRGYPTVEAEIYLENGTMGRASVPSGASTGEHEAVELRDGNSQKYSGKSVLIAVGHINNDIQKAVLGFDIAKQKEFDSLLIKLDGTPNKSRLGANAILAASLAYARVTSRALKIPLYQFIGDLYGNNKFSLPVPMMNILNGGAHASNNVDLQEFMIMPLKFNTFSESLMAGSEIFHGLQDVLKARGLTTTVGDEGGVAPNLSSNEEALEVIIQGIEKAGYEVGEEIGLALDSASSEFFEKGDYILENETPKVKTVEDMCKFYSNLADKFPIYSIEDGLDENDWEGWRALTEQLGKKMQLVGDDLFVTNTNRLKEGIEKGVANSILIKVNQIGTLSETLDAIQMAHDAGYTAVISHRSGETEDTTIADLAVGTAAGQIKTGSLCRTDRVCKYNQLLRIEEELGDNAVYPGRSIFKFL